MITKLHSLHYYNTKNNAQAAELRVKRLGAQLKCRELIFFVPGFSSKKASEAEMG